MKKLALLAIIAAGAWWYFVGGRKLSEDDVNSFYREYEVATLQRRPDTLCSSIGAGSQGQAP